MFKFINKLKYFFGFFFYNKKWKICDVTSIGSAAYNITIVNVKDENEKLSFMTHSINSLVEMVGEDYHLEYQLYMELKGIFV